MIQRLTRQVFPSISRIGSDPNDEDDIRPQKSLLAVRSTQTTCELIKDELVCQTRGTVNVKGKGEMQAWFVVSEKQDHQPAANAIL